MGLISVVFIAAMDVLVGFEVFEYCCYVEHAGCYG
jgi:hypothetical protein